MARLILRIDPVFVGPASDGTADHITLLRAHLGLELGDAKALIDRCVLGGEPVTIEVPSRAAATALAVELASLPGPARVEVHVEDDAADP
jgi:hypothetical protein